MNTEKINYVAQYYQKYAQDENKFVDFFKVSEDCNIETCLKKVKALTAQLEEAKDALNTEYAKKYSNKYTPIERPNLFYYKTRNGEDYYYDTNGSLVNIPNIKDYNVLSLDTKHGDIDIVDGYCYELGSIVIKRCRYNIAADNSKCSLRFGVEFIIPFLDEENYGRSSNGFTVRRTWEFNNTLHKYSAKEFLDGLYGINTPFTGNLKDIYDYKENNPAFELILKTAPDSLVNLLLAKRNIEKPEPIYKLLGLDKPVYEEALANGMEVICYELSNYITNKEVFHKSGPEWMEMIKDFIQKENDLDFFHINYGTSWRYKNYEHCKLLGVLAESYAGNKWFQKYYTFGKFCNYIVEETINQGFTSIENFIQQLQDYLRMCDDQDIVPTLYSSYLTQTHDIAARNHKVFLDQEQEKILAKRYEGFKPIKVGKEKEYQILAPKNSDDIKKEGDALNHCVASYIKRVLDGETKIFFMRKEPLESLITLEVKDGKICQARGMHNRRPTEEENAAIKEFAKKKELIFNCAY